jgi:hypothetical protein
MRREDKAEYIAACQPQEPVPPGDPRHHDFDRPDLNLRGQPWRDRLAEVIELASNATTQLVTGLRGSGKTTELQQLRAALEVEGYEVIMTDVGAWLSDDRPLASEDLLLAAVLAIHPDGAPEQGRDWAREAGERFRKFLLSRVDLEGSAMGLKARLTTDQTLFQRVAQQLAERDGLREEVHDVLAHANRKSEKPLVLILDGAEKRATGEVEGRERREAFHNRWVGNFTLHGRDLRLPVHTIYTVPPFMIRRSPEIAASFGAELQFLPMVRVFQHDGGLDAKGLREVALAAYKRIPAERFDDPRIVPYLAGATGGYFRDLLRALTEMVYLVGDAPAFTRAHADKALAKIRQSYREAFVQEDRQILATVHEQRRFPDTEDALPRMDALLLGYRMFRYHNDEPWYDAHPLLWPELGGAQLDWDAVAEACAG